jgi:hypothetical protein
MFEPPPELLKRLLMKSFVRSSEAACEGYMMSKKVDTKVQRKIKGLEVNLLYIFPRRRKVW